MVPRPGTTAQSQRPDITTAAVLRRQRCSSNTRTSGRQDTYSGPWNARASPILEVGNPAVPFIPLRGTIAMPRQFANVRLLTVHGYSHTAFLTRAPARGTP
jgi:hypothetical protein